MQTWEYTRVFVEFGEATVVGGKGTLASAKGTDVDEALSQLGSQGWELAGTVSSPNAIHQYVLFLKRSISH